VQGVITLNGRLTAYKLGWTVESLLVDMNFTYPKIFVKVNGEHIDEADYGTTAIREGDVVHVIHLMAGG